MTSELLARFEKRFPRGPVIRGDLRRPSEGFSLTVLFGPSGCGKTTILRCLAGLERPDQGIIRFGEETWFDADRGIFRRPQQRDIGYLFQDYALFPHLTVAGNITYGLSGVTRGERARKLGDMLDLFGLTGTEHRYPHQVSGGQQQRIALARVLVRRPRLLLLDEPLSALDASLREEIRWELRRLLSEFAIPIVLVTHDRIEAMSLADEVVVLEDGMVRQSGPVHEVFTRPADLSVAHIVGIETVLPGHVIEIKDGLAAVQIGEVLLTAVAPEHCTDTVHVCIRAEEVVLHRGSMDHTSVRNRLTARVTSLLPEGPLIRVTLDCRFSLMALITRPACQELGLQPGDTVTALLKAPAIHLIPRVP